MTLANGNEGNRSTPGEEVKESSSVSPRVAQVKAYLADHGVGPSDLPKALVVHEGHWSWVALVHMGGVLRVAALRADIDCGRQDGCSAGPV